MAKEKSLTSAEWNIMEHLWSDAPQSLMQLVAALEPTTNWSKSTIATMLSRMEEKRLVRYETVGRARQYYPMLPREEAALKETSSLLERAYSGSLGLLVSTMVENKAVSREELDKLYAILQKVEEEL